MRLSSPAMLTCRSMIVALALIYGCGGSDEAGTDAQTAAATDGTMTPTSSPTDGTSVAATDGPATSTSEPTSGSSGEETLGTTSEPTTGAEELDWVVPLRGVLVTSMARDPNGDLVLAGYQYGSLSAFGSTDLAEIDDIFATFLVRLDPAGAVKWHRSFDTNSQPMAIVEPVAAVAIGPTGEIVLTGMYNKAVDLGDGPLPSANDNDLFLAAFTADGAPLWSRALSAPGAQYGSAVAIDPNGDIFLGGAFEGEITVGADMLVSQGDTDILLAKFTSAGEATWGRAYGDALGDAALGLAMDGAGDLVLLAMLYGDIADFGGGPIADLSCCTWNGIVAKFDADGLNTWAVANGGASAPGSSGLSTCQDGSVIAATGGGLFARSSGGAALWDLSAEGLEVNGVACDSSGEVLAAGHLINTEVTDIGDGPLGPFDADPALIARFSGGGGLLSKSLISATSPVAVESARVEPGPGGEVTFVVSTAFGDIQVDLGDGPVAGDAFLVRRHD